MALQSDIEETLLCFLRRGRPLTHKQLGAELKASQPTVRRRVSALREQGWLLNHLGGLGGDLLLLNVNRAGFKAFTDYLYTEHGVTVGPYLWAVDNPGKIRRIDHHDPHTRNNDEQDRLFGLASVAAGTDVADDGAGIEPRDVREYTAKARRVWSTCRRLETTMHHVWKNTRLERAREFIHLLGHLDDELIDIIDLDYGFGLNPREVMCWLALTIRHNAETYAKYAHAINVAAQRSHQRSEASDQLTEWAINQVMPDTAPHKGGLHAQYRVTAKAELVREIDGALGRIQPGNHITGVGRGGDILLAQELNDTVADLWDLIEQIRAFPALGPLFDTPSVAAEMEKGPRIKNPWDGYPVPKVESVGEKWAYDPDVDRFGPPDTAVDPAEVDGAHLRAGDQLMRVANQPVPGEPVVAANDGIELLLMYEPYIRVEVHAEGFTRGKPCLIRRPEEG